MNKIIEKYVTPWALMTILAIFAFFGMPPEISKTFIKELESVIITVLSILISLFVAVIAIFVAIEIRINLYIKKSLLNTLLLLFISLMMSCLTYFISLCLIDNPQYPTNSADYKYIVAGAVWIFLLSLYEVFRIFYVFVDCYWLDAD